ncbi:MAG: hypothetical protein AAFR66_04335 [Bacteroidota bacterium]
MASSTQTKAHKLVLHRLRTVKDLSDSFNECYPFLRLGFYEHTHKRMKSSPNSELISEELTLGDVCEEVPFLVVDIDQKRIVGQLEEELQDKLGLGVQVLRWIRNRWSQTAFNDDWTLERHNREAEVDDKMFGEM